MTTTTTRHDADVLLDIATGYMAAKQLFVAVRVGLFPALEGNPRTAAELAEALGVPEHSVAILANSMNALGLVEREHGVYRNGPAATRYLSGAGSLDLGPFFSFLDGVSYPHWEQFESTIRSGTHGELSLGDFPVSAIGAGIGAFQRLHVEQFADLIDVSGKRRLLDLGGQSPYFAIAAMQANPGLETDFVYQPGEEAMVVEALEGAGLASRATVAGTPTPEALTGDAAAALHDLVLLNHCIHRFTGDENTAILRHARAVSEADAELIIVDFIADESPRERRIDALHGAEYLVIDSTVTHQLAAIESWLSASGWKLDRVIELPGSPRAVIASAV